MREIKANELDRVSKRHEVVINKICDLYFNSHSNINQLRKELTQLSIYGDQFSRIGRKSKEYSENILNKLNDIEDNRSKLLSSTDSPQWEIKHHFHILSFEHFRGNTQPHLIVKLFFLVFFYQCTMSNLFWTTVRLFVFYFLCSLCLLSFICFLVVV